MELPTILNVKSEKVDLEFEKETQILDFHFDIKIESEAQHVLENYHWSIENEPKSPSNTGSYWESENFHQLTQLLKQQCTRCERCFDDRYSLIQHNVTHLNIFLTQCTSLLKYKCDICNIFYNTKDKLKEHITVIHGSKYNVQVKYSERFEFESNDKIFEEKSPPEYNQQNMSNCNKLLISKSQRQCTECGKIFTYKSWFSHMKSVHSNIRSICKICKQTFKCERYLRRHILYQHGNIKPSWRFNKIAEKEINCEKCPAVFNNKNSLKTHMKNCHTESVECDLCKSKLKSRTYLNTHMKRVHYNDGKEHKCKMCGKKFKSPRYVKIHMKNKHGVS